MAMRFKAGDIRRTACLLHVKMRRRACRGTSLHRRRKRRMITYRDEELVRKYDESLSMEQIKTAMEKGVVVIRFDPDNNPDNNPKGLMLPEVEK